MEGDEKDKERNCRWNQVWKKRVETMMGEQVVNEVNGVKWIEVENAVEVYCTVLYCDVLHYTPPVG